MKIDQLPSDIVAACMVSTVPMWGMQACTPCQASQRAQGGLRHPGT